jgi:DNA-directed RNA polymerase subunit RPC12/RpoP
VPRAPGQTDDVLAARAVNAEPWEPLPGMVKQRCSQCGYFFAVLVAEAEATSRCPDCAGRPALP